MNTRVTYDYYKKEMCVSNKDMYLQYKLFDF